MRFDAIWHTDTLRNSTLRAFTRDRAPKNGYPPSERETDFYLKDWFWIYWSKFYDGFGTTVRTDRSVANGTRKEHVDMTINTQALLFKP